MTDEATEGGFAWSDGSAVDYLEWMDGEPNNYGDEGEQCVTMGFLAWKQENGQWEDSACGLVDPNTAGGPSPRPVIGICQLSPPPAPMPGAPMVWGTGQTSSFRIQVCVDHVDNVPTPPNISHNPVTFPIHRHILRSRFTSRTTDSGSSTVDNVK